jgi:putative ABC transport system permease protein
VKYLPLVLRNLLRRKVRTVFTLLCVLVAFLLFCYLAAIDLAFSLGVDVTGADRLVVIHKTSLILPLPVSYVGRISAIPGVVDVAHATWFGGKYQDRENQFPIFAVDPERFMRLYPEYLLPPEQLQAWLADRTGAIVGRGTAERFGMKVGDRVPIQGTIFRPPGGDIWAFTIRGIYEPAKRGVDDTLFAFHYDFLNEGRDHSEDLTGWYIVRVADPEQAAQVARAIDTTFANSFYETETSTEKVFVEGFAKQIGNIGRILRFVATAVFFTILLVAGNTMAQAVRERTSEMAVLKTVGFTDGIVLALVLAESLALSILGGGLGLALGYGLISWQGDPTGRFLPVFYMPGHRVVLGIVLILALGLVSGLLPAVRAMRLRIVDALRRV